MKTLINIDRSLLRAAAPELGTATTEETVNAALALIAARQNRRIELLKNPLNVGIGPDIGDAEIMRGAHR